VSFPAPSRVRLTTLEASSPIEPSSTLARGRVGFPQSFPPRASSFRLALHAGAEIARAGSVGIAEGVPPGRACQTEPPTRKGAALAGRMVFVAACRGDIFVFRIPLPWRGGGCVLRVFACGETLDVNVFFCCTCGSLLLFPGKTEWWWRFPWLLIVGLPQCVRCRAAAMRQPYKPCHFVRTLCGHLHLAPYLPKCNSGTEFAILTAVENSTEI
jgi:hypothetical protein